MLWFWHIAVEMNPITLLAGLMIGGALALPYVVDRFLAPRLDLVGELLLFPIVVTSREPLLSVIASPFGTISIDAELTTSGLAKVSVLRPIQCLIRQFGVSLKWRRKIGSRNILW
jgi:hypothetical protein